jgi:hypothetical protein
MISLNYSAPAEMFHNETNGKCSNGEGNAHTVSVGKPEGKRYLGRSGSIKVKVSFKQAAEAQSVVRRPGSHIF